MIKIVGFCLSDIRAKGTKTVDGGYLLLLFLETHHQRAVHFSWAVGKRDARRRDYQCCILDKVI